MPNNLKLINFFYGFCDRKRPLYLGYQNIINPKISVLNYC